MKYYLIEISEGDKDIAGTAIYVYETLELAIAAFHQKMSTAIKSPLFKREQLTIINSQNGIYEKYSEVWEKTE